MACISASVGRRRVTIFKSSAVVTFTSRSCHKNESAPTLRTSHGCAVSGLLQDSQEAQVLLLLQQAQRLRAEVRRHDNFAEDLRDRFRAGRIERAVHRDDAAERGLAVRGQRLVPGFAQAGPLAHAAGVGVLEDGQRRRVGSKLRDQVRRRGQVQNIIVGKLLAVQLLKVLVKPP